MPAHRPFALRLGGFGRLCAALLGLAAGVRAAGAAATAPNSSVDYLKRLTLEELLTLEVTTVSRRPEHFSATASAISVLTGDDVRRSGATTLADALRYSTGLAVARIDGRTWGVASRGFNVNASNKLLVMLDGRSLYTPLFSGVFWDVQDTELTDLDRIEVVRGPGATMWGANAVNGVINIRTKSARDTLGALVTVGGGDEERQFASARQGFKLGAETFARVYVKQFHRDDLVYANGTDAGTDATMVQGGFRLDAGATERPDAFTLQGDLYHGFLGGTNQVATRVAGGNVLGRWTHVFSPGRSLQTQLYYDRVERSAPGQFAENRDTFDLDTQFTTTLAANHNVVFGLTGRTSADETDATGTIRFSPVTRRIEVLSGLVQDEIGFFQDRLGVTLGAKFEHNNSTGFEFQPSVRVAWRPAENRTFWAAIARAVRTPTRFDEDLRFTIPPSTVFVSGSTDFRSETLVAYEVGWRYHPNPRWSIDTNVFHHRYDDMRSQERSTTPGVFFVLQNRLNANTTGGTISLYHQATDWWRLRAVYSHLAKQLSLDPGSTDPTRGQQEGNDPRHLFTLASTFDLPGRWEFNLMARHVGELPAPLVPAYTEVDLSLAWRPTPAWEFSLTGQNLLHAHHREFGAAGPATQELERGVYAKVVLRF